MSKHAMTRGWMDSEMWDEAPFTEREAWVWMIGEAAWKDRHAPINGKRVFLSRGQFSHSLRFMADKFKWSKKKVECYLEKLKIWDAIKTDNGTGQNIITVCNYEKHQFLGDSQGDSEGDDRGTGRGQEGDKEEEIPKYLREKEEADAATRATAVVTLDPQKENFRKIYDHGSEIFPQLATRNTAIIHRWVEAGADPERDVFPEMERHRGRNIQAWGYFTGAIMDAIATRNQPLPEGKPKNAPDRNQNGNHQSPNRNFQGGASKHERAKAALRQSAIDLGYAQAGHAGQANPVEPDPAML